MDAPKPLELVPLDGPGEETAPAAVVATPEEAALDAIEIVPLERPIPIANSGGKKIDPYVQQAAREYAEGHIDEPLWLRALAQANGDKTAAAAVYVRARGTALRLFDRDRGVEPLRAIRPSAPRPATASRGSDDYDPPPEVGAWQRYRYAILTTAVVIPLVAGGGWYVLSGATGQDPQVASTKRAATPKPADIVAAAKAANPPSTAPNSPSSPDFRNKIQELADAGNWNVLVLYAVEWTRKEPTNATAWDQLRMGYMYLRQYDDALNAATKAVKLAPEEARLWRHVGQINLDIDDPAAALAAFDQAATLNPHDLASLQNVGLLQARLGRPQEARTAFDRALAVTPNEAVTSCLRTAVAQMPPVKDAYTMSRTIRAIDDKCRGRSDPVAATK